MDIDRLVTEGMNFEQAYAPAANCAPSRACVHSGQWGARHGVYTVSSSERGKAEYRKIIPVKNRHHLPPEIYTMAEALKDGGYRTIHLGKYHIGEDPLQDGFEVNVGGDQRGGPSAGGYYSPWEKGPMKKWSDSVPYLVHTPLTPVPEYVDHYKDTGLNATYASMVEKFDWAVGKLLAALDEKGLAENTLVVFCSDNGGIAAFHSQAAYVHRHRTM